MRLEKITRCSGRALTIAGVSLLTACQSDKVTSGDVASAVLTKSSNTDPVFTNRSVTPALVKNVMRGVSVTTLISSDDRLAGSPTFVFGGSVDGMGLLPTATGWTLLANNEDNYAVSRIQLDRNFAPVSGSYPVNSDNTLTRLCSATLATPEEHGFNRPLFLTAGESGANSQIWALDPFAMGQNTAVALPALGKFNAEQAVPLPTTAFRGKTVVIIGDDDSGTYGGQLAMYVGDGEGNLTTGKLYLLARSDDNTRERDMVTGGSYAVEFREVVDQQTKTGDQINLIGRSLKAMEFGRVEDVDYRRGGVAHARDVYFAVTGQDGNAARSKHGRIYHLALDSQDPLRGTLEVVLDGDDRAGPAGQFQNPDNITVTKNNIYIQEDPNGYGDETHDARVYQYDLNTKQLKVVLELDHRRDAVDAAKYNVPVISKLGDWEVSGMIDVSQQTGEKGTFLLGIQSHTWRGAPYAGADGGARRRAENQASQIVVLRGLDQ